MIGCLDVAYGDTHAIAACVLAARWNSATEEMHVAARVNDILPYEPGSFYKRELPCLLQVLAATRLPDVLIVDGYAWIAPGHPGLGVHLFDALGGAVPVVGVAKTSFMGAAGAVEVLRGQSRNPLYVTAIGIDVNQAATHVAAMHGKNRLPTLLKLVDTHVRQGLAADAQLRDGSGTVP